jgi:hypothetical protein
MTELRNVLLLLAALVAGTAPGVSGAPPAGGKAPAALEQVRQSFATAVAAKDRAAMAKLSRFPIGLAVYRLPPKLSEDQFLHKADYFEGLFFGGDAEIVTCLRTKAFEYDSDRKDFGGGLWVLDCNGNEYYFGARAGQWAFVAYENINE